MRVYSPFFHTLHDEAGPIGSLGRGTHYSILRAVLWVDLPTPSNRRHRREAMFHDFAVVWDEDHDTRIIWVLERLYVEQLLEPVLAIGERKGGVTVVTRTEEPASSNNSSEYYAAVVQITENVPTDAFGAEIVDFDDPHTIVNDSVDKVQAYLSGIDALWALGGKPCEFSIEPFLPPPHALLSSPIPGSKYSQIAEADRK